MKNKSVTMLPKVELHENVATQRRKEEESRYLSATCYMQTAFSCNSAFGRTVVMDFYFVGCILFYSMGCA